MQQGEHSNLKWAGMEPVSSVGMGGKGVASHGSVGR